MYICPGLSEAGPALSEAGPGLSGADQGLSEPVVAAQGQPLRGLGEGGGGTDRRRDRRTDRFPLFHRTSSPQVPSGAAALLT